jgi:phosphate transport system substrate-binding protein
MGLVAAALAVGAGPSASTALAAGPTITGTGSSYAAVAIDQWVAQMQSIYGDAVNYQTSSSVIGMNDYAQRQVDFGASEIGYSTGQANNTPASGSYQYLPDVAGATCLMYNLTGSVGNHVTNLRLDPAVMTGIFTGKITNWSDPAIRALNRGVPLPNRPIVVTFRTDASGENYLFGDYLQHEEPSAWAAYTHTLGFPDAPQAIWPYPQQGGSSGSYSFTNWVGESGSDNASNYVASNAGTITYVETAYALLHHEPCASIRNASGNYVAPSELNDAVALERAQLLPDLEQKLAGVYSNPLKQAYPISAYSYLLVALSPRGTIDPAKGKVLGQFVDYFACAGQQAAGQLGYSPLPPNLVQEDLNGIARITGAAAPPKLSASTCKNPYVDGQTPLPGEPSIAGGGPTVPASAAGHRTGADGGSNPSAAGASTGVATGGAASSGAATGGTVAAGKAARGGGAAGGTAGVAGSAGSTAAGGASVTGLYPGEQMVAGLSTGSKLPDKSFVGIELQSAGRGVRSSSAMGMVLALLFVVALAAPTGVLLRRRRRVRLLEAGQLGIVGTHDIAGGAA